MVYYQGKQEKLEMNNSFFQGVIKMTEPDHPFSAESDDDTSSYYTIEQVAIQTGMTKRTLRYYEEMGLLPPTSRTGGNYRRYTDAEVQRLQRIKKLRDLLGVSLQEIRELLEAEEERGQIKQAYKQETDALAKKIQLERADELILQQIQLIEQKIAGLEQMRTALFERLERHKQKKKELDQNK
jgi:MerR family transcriptional regulator, repressor of the yfmOP operon